MDTINEQRYQKDQFFAQDSQSPLTPAQRQAFTGLVYFPPSADWVFELPLERFPERNDIQIQTSTGDMQRYQRVGKISFAIAGQQAELTIFANHYGLFLPFVDSLAGTETYPAGRYLEPELMPDGKVRVDFNQAYNPYCAYNDEWSCPLTPAENRLKVPIRAGEKIFHHEEDGEV